MTTLYARDLSAWPHERMRDNVLAVWERSTSTERDRGAAWYAEARDHASLIGDILGESMPVGAGVIAVLSPQTEWNANLADAYRCATTFADGTFTDADDYRAYRTNVWRAWHIMSEPHNVESIVCTPTSPKVSAFWRAIVGLPGGPCIDRHATRVATAYTYDAVTARTFREVQSAYISAAQESSLDEHTLQATVWLTCKRELQSTIGQQTLGWY